MYNRRTPNDFPIDAKNMIHNMDIRTGATNNEPPNDMAERTDMLLHTRFGYRKKKKR